MRAPARDPVSVGPLALPARCLVMVCGPPGAGKTTWAARVAPDAERLDIDGLRARCAPAPGELSDFATAIEAMIAGAAHALGAGRPVIVEHVGVRPQLTEALAQVARDRDVPVHVICLNVPFELALEGQRQRGRVLAEQTNAFYREMWASTAGGQMVGIDADADDVLVLDRAGADAVTTLKFG